MAVAVEPSKAARAGGTALYDAWVRRAHQLVAVENGLVRAACGPLCAGIARAHARFNYHRGEPESWDAAHILNWLTIDLHQARADWAKVIDGFTGEFIPRWLGVQARALVAHLPRRHRGMMLDHLRKTPVITEAKRTTTTATINPADILAELFRQLTPADLEAFRKSKSAGLAKVRINTALDRSLRASQADIERAIKTKAPRRTTIRRVRAVAETFSAAAERITRTHVQTLAYDTEEHLLRAAGPAVRRVQWTAILDARTCLVCGKLHGTEWRVKYPHRPTIPRHDHCRCMWIPVPRGVTLPPPTETYDDFLRRQTAAKQREILGPTRYELFRKGVPAERFVNRLRRVTRVGSLPEPGHIPKSWKR